MANYLSAGIFIEETQPQNQPIQGVSTSTYAVIGFTPKGPSNIATLVTSWNDYVNKFGGLTRNSFAGYSLNAFFNNGGSRAYVVRVTPSDATSASAKIQSQVTDLQIVSPKPDGSTVTFSATSGTTLFPVNSGASPLVASSVSIRWRAAGSPVVTQQLKQRDGITNMTGDGATAKFEGVITGLPTFDNGLDAIVPATVTLKWTNGGGAATLALSSVNSSNASIYSGTNANGTSATIDHKTGRISMTFGSTPTNDVPTATAINVGFTPATSTFTLTDDGVGGLPAGSILTAPGTINYTTGVFSFTTVGGDKPHNLANVLATFKYNPWSLAPISAGTWANTLRYRITGSADAYTASTATYSKFNVQIQLADSSTPTVFETKESYDDLVFTLSVPASPSYFANVINAGSALSTVATPAGNAAPNQLNGIARLFVPAGGDESTNGRALSFTLPNAPIAARTVSIAYTDNTGTTQTITDDGVGNLVGAVDTTVTNTINYTTGVVSTSTLSAKTIKANTLVVVSYYSAPAETAHLEQFGDSTKSYTQGTDGTFDSIHYTREQFSDSATLQPTYQGLFALDKVDELLQVSIPDFAGDVTVTGDLLTYASFRTGLPSGGDRFVILTVPKGSQPTDAVNWFQFKLAQYSDYAAVYWPWISIADPLNNGAPLTVPPMGHVAGIFARTDSTRNVGKAPGGTVDGALRGLIGLEYNATLSDRDTVYPRRINPLINSTATGLAVWGVRTISSNLNWKYINARRLFMFLEKSIFNSTQWIVFENNGPGLWARIKAQLNGYLSSLYQQGYFAGATPSQAYFVVCDETNNTPATINAGEVIVDVGVAPSKPAEFCIFRMSQLTSN